MKVEHYVSPNGYGQHWTLLVRGQHRVQVRSRRTMTPMRPHIYSGADENCNRSWSVHMWPLFGVHAWWEWPWRPAGSGYCDRCINEFQEASMTICKRCKTVITFVSFAVAKTGLCDDCREKQEGGK